MQKSFWIALFLCSILAIKPSAAQEQSGRFHNLDRTATRTRIDFRLAKVDQYNLAARQSRLPIISYKAYKTSYGGLEFKFLHLTTEQFHIVKTLYGNVGRSQPMRGVHDYNFLDFMPPLVQALNGQSFKYAASVVPEINVGRFGALGEPTAPIDKWVRTSSNCFSTAYEIAHRGSFLPNSNFDNQFTLFLLGRFQAMDAFTQLSEGIGSVSIDQRSAAGLPRDLPVQTGDVLLVILNRQLIRRTLGDKFSMPEPHALGSVISMPEHAVTYIDRGLVFEKQHAGEKGPYRLVSLRNSMRPYSNQGDIQIQVRRFSQALPSAHERFGGTSSAVKESWTRPLPKILEGKIIMIKELSFPWEGEYYNSWQQTVDLPLVLDKSTGRFRFTREAYSSDTYDINATLARCAPSLVPEISE